MTTATTGHKMWAGFKRSHGTIVILVPSTDIELSHSGISLQQPSEVPTDLLRFVDSNISRLRRRAKIDGTSPVPAGVEKKLRRLLAHCASPSAVFPAVSSTERGGAHLYWRAGAQSIEVLMENVQEFYVRIVSHTGLTTFEQEGVGDLPSAEIGTALADLSDRVARANPEWRSLFSL